MIKYLSTLFIGLLTIYTPAFSDDLFIPNPEITSWASTGAKSITVFTDLLAGFGKYSQSHPKVSLSDSSMFVGFGMKINAITNKLDLEICTHLSAVSVSHNPKSEKAPLNFRVDAGYSLLLPVFPIFNAKLFLGSTFQRVGDGYKTYGIIFVFAPSLGINLAFKVKFLPAMQIQLMYSPYTIDNFKKNRDLVFSLISRLNNSKSKKLTELIINYTNSSYSSNYTDFKLNLFQVGFRVHVFP